MKVGERYVIEIDKVYVPMKIGEDFKLARIKGFNSLVFDENGLSKLVPLEDNTFLRIERDKARQEGFEEGKEVGYNEAMNTTRGAWLAKALAGVEKACDEARQKGFEEGKKVGYNEALIECEDNHVLNDDCKEEKIDLQKYDVCTLALPLRTPEFCITHIYKVFGDTYVDAICKNGTVVYQLPAENVSKIGHIDSLDKWLEGE